MVNAELYMTIEKAFKTFGYDDYLIRILKPMCYSTNDVMVFEHQFNSHDKARAFFDVAKYRNYLMDKRKYTFNEFSIDFYFEQHKALERLVLKEVQLWELEEFTKRLDNREFSLGGFYQFFQSNRKLSLFRALRKYLEF